MKNCLLCCVLIPCVAISSCTTGTALQPDRAIFSLDNNYQRYYYSQGIEKIFEATLNVFRDAGYSIDVADRATGQISGVRGASGDSRSRNDKDLKFYALVVPSRSGSEVAIKIVQVLRSGTLGASRAEIIVSDAQMYQYAFRRIENAALQSQDSDNAGEVEELPASSSSSRSF